MDQREREQLGRQQPLGKVIKKNPDGTVLIEFDLSNPIVAEMVVAQFSGGVGAANEVLKRHQSHDQN